MDRTVTGGVEGEGVYGPSATGFASGRGSGMGVEGLGTRGFGIEGAGLGIRAFWGEGFGGAGLGVRLFWGEGLGM